MKKIKWILRGSLLAAIPLLMAFVSLPAAYFLSEPACTKPDTKGIESFPSTELYKMLEGKKPEDFRYFFKSFFQEGENVFMVVNFRSKQQCFDVRMKVEKWDKLADMKKTNGLSYPKELYDLVWKIEERSGKREIVYQDMHPIID